MKKITENIFVLMLLVGATASTLIAGDIPTSDALFHKADYKAKQFHVREKHSKFGDLDIVTIEVSNSVEANNGEPNDWDCRAWLMVKKEKKVLSSYYFPEIDPVGDNFGVEAIPTQPLVQYFFWKSSVVTTPFFF